MSFQWGNGLPQILKKVFQFKTFGFPLENKLALMPKADAKLALHACTSGNGRNGGALLCKMVLRALRLFP